MNTYLIDYNVIDYKKRLHRGYHVSDGSSSSTRLELIQTFTVDPQADKMLCFLECEESEWTTDRLVCNNWLTGDIFTKSQHQIDPSVDPENT